MIEFQQLEELPLSDSIILLAYGASGSGKTHFAGSAAYNGRALMINIGGGITTLANPNFRRLYPLASKMLVATIREDANPQKATGYDEVCKAIELGFQKRLEDFDTVIVDDMTAIRRFAMSKAIELNAKGGRSETKAKFKNDDASLVTVADWGTEMRLTENFIIDLVSYCREFSKNLICTAHERVNFKAATKVGDEPTVTKQMPGFTGRTFPDAVTGHFDCTWHFETIGAGDTTKYRIRTMGDESLTCNTKWSGLFKTLEDSTPTRRFDFPLVQKMIRDSLKS